MINLTMDNMRRLQAAPLGRPPQFKDPTTIPPFTAEQKLADALAKVARYHGVSKSEILRRAVKIGLRAMINDVRAERSSTGTD
jgi:hypothetical protein